MTIDECTESTKECVGSVSAIILEIKSAANWWYSSCKNYNRKAEPISKKYCCERCDDFVLAIPRVQVTVIDSTGSTSFVLFVRIVAQWIGKSASKLVDASYKENHSIGYVQSSGQSASKLLDASYKENHSIGHPSEINRMIGKESCYEEDETISAENNSQEVDDNIKSPKKRVFVDVDTSSLPDDVATKASSNKPLKKVKVEKD
ncbi:PREDICTED: uncharacterized protein LOC105971098 [Erythranthe guttata]|uniref:uncharacterized protein LOC105971098 n=1 Tax=Erythranthe guttata TaxID=4155 RepID=UPI00064DDB5D|nr:PREDICTED: uncharacterized protein LOC105971098 [Erythranthe guttata]|eukprot:XP_012851398.1 PREDICTED: uncharacterized protein LOC105971098 [Erythranthe guttata]